jgi:hypothetical protein
MALALSSASLVALILALSRLFWPNENKIAAIRRHGSHLGQNKLEARKMLETAAESPPSSARCVSPLLVKY